MDRIPPGGRNLYGFVPDKAACIIFIVFFSLSTLIHLAQATARRQWFMLVTAVVSGILEVIGWSGRLWSHHDVLNFMPFQIQILCTLVAPTPLLAANFVIFGRIIGQLGSQFSRLNPKRYTIIFCGCDILALCIQGAGGAVAATAKTDVNIQRGSDIMLAGIVFQAFVIIAFTALAIETFHRYRKNAPLNRKRLASEKDTRGELTQNIKYMLYALVFCTACLFVRSIYRVAELADGWEGRIMSTQSYFNWLDGAMIVLALYTFNIAHPGWLLAGINVFGNEVELEQGNGSIETAQAVEIEKGHVSKI